MLERYITPYQFAITDCHVRGDFCWYPGQLSAPSPNDPRYKLCDYEQCQPVRVSGAFNDSHATFPIDEKTLVQAFSDYNNSTIGGRDTATEWFNYHFENFIQISDLQELKRTGVTHLRVPLPHWILGNVESTTTLDSDEGWIVGTRWASFVRVCKWARKFGLQVWPDIHTAPGSQNGFGTVYGSWSLFAWLALPCSRLCFGIRPHSQKSFFHNHGCFIVTDNSGEALPYTTCQVWSNNPIHVETSLHAIRSISQGIVDAEIQDVVTGFGLLNEPFADCDRSHYGHFMQSGLDIVREILGPQTAVYVSDMFQESLFNDGHWWLNPAAYSNTFLDSHYYQVFDQITRDFSPRQHIAFACENHKRRTTSCCFRDPPHNQRPSHGVSRMIGEWSASFDILPSARINEIMAGIANTGVAPYFDRQLTPERKEFLRSYVQAQIVTFENADAKPDLSAWFYWTMKMEGGAFAEWSFLRGAKEGWFPSFPDPNESSQLLFGNCSEILSRTSDDRLSILEVFPDPIYLPPPSNASLEAINDDAVISHGESYLHPEIHKISKHSFHRQRGFVRRHWLLVVVVIIALIVGALRLLRRERKRAKYTPLKREISMTV